MKNPYDPDSVSLSLHVPYAPDLPNYLPFSKHTLFSFASMPLHIICSDGKVPFLPHPPFSSVRSWFSISVQIFSPQGNFSLLVIFVPESMKYHISNFQWGLFECQWDQCKWCKSRQVWRQISSLMGPHNPILSSCIFPTFLFSIISVMGNYLN